MVHVEIELLINHDKLALSPVAKTSKVYFFCMYASLTWKARRHQRGHHDTVGPLGGIKQVSMGVMMFLQCLFTQSCAHSDRVTQESSLVVIDTVPVNCNQNVSNTIISALS